MSLLGSSIPIPLSSKTRTKKKYDVGHARNGQHIRIMKFVKVWMEISTSDHTYCRCGYRIKAGEIYGSDSLLSYCKNCIVIPKWAKAYEFSITTKRKTKRGNVKKYVSVMSQAKAKEYLRQVKQENREYEVKEIQFANEPYDIIGAAEFKQSQRASAMISMDSVKEIEF